MIRWRLLAGAAAAAVAAPAMHYWRGQPGSLALVVAVAVGALGFLLVRAVQNLSAWRPRR